MIAKEQDAGASRDDPDGEDYAEINAIENFQTAAQRGCRDLKYILERARCAESSDLEPSGCLLRGERTGDKKATRFFTAQFSAGGFGNTAGRNQFDAVGRNTESLRNFVGDGGSDRGTPRRIAFPRFGDHD